MTGKQQGTPVVVTTEHRGVFFGYLEGGNPAGSTTDPIIITQAQMCVYWSSDVRGVLGLAATGPTKNCKITPPVPAITLHKITAVMAASDEAVISWKAQPWSR